MKVLKLLITFSLVSTTLIWGASSQYFNTEGVYYDVVDADSLAYVEDETLWIEEDTVWDEEDTVYVDEPPIEDWHSFDDDSTWFYIPDGQDNPLLNLEEDLGAKNYKKILADTEKVLAEYPDASDARYYASYASYYLKDYKRAIELATDLGAEYPADNRVFNLLSLVGRNNDRYMLSLLKKKIVEKEVDDYYYPLESASTIDLMAQLAREYGYLIDEIGYLDQLENKIPSLYDEQLICYDAIEDFYPLMRKVVSYMNMDEYNTALQLLDSMSEDERGLAWYLNKFGCLRGANGLESALKFEQEALEKYPAETYFINNYIIDLTLAGKYDEAIAQADKSIESEFTETEFLPELYLRRGIAKKLSGNKEDAEKDFLKTIEVANNYDNGPLTIAKCYLGMKEEVLKNLDDAENGAFMVTVYNILGMTDKALEKLGDAYEKCKWTPLKSKYDIHHQSLLSHPSFAKIAKQFQPHKRRL